MTTHSKVLAFATLAIVCGAFSVAAKTRTVAIVLYDGVEVLDFAGPAEVFESAGHFGAAGGDHANPAFRLFTVALTKDPILSQRFLHVVPDYSIDDAPHADIIVLPGGGTGAVTANPKFMEWARSAARESELTLTVCTGPFVLGKNGLLDGLDVTTWYDAVDRLQKEVPEARVHAGRRFIDSGQFVTTAGVSAGIDGSLHVVARLLGRNVADRTARYMEYRWTPESHLAKQYSYLNPSLDDEGRRRQQAQIFLDEKDYERAVNAYREILAGDPGDGASWLQLGRIHHETERYAEAVEAYRSAAAIPAVRAIALYNMACAHARNRETDRAIEALTEFYEAAGSNRPPGEAVLGDPDFASIRDDARFVKLVGGQ